MEWQNYNELSQDYHEMGNKYLMNLDENLDYPNYNQENAQDYKKYIYRENLDNINQNEIIQNDEANNNPGENKDNEYSVKTPKKEDSEDLNSSIRKSQIYESEDNNLNDVKEKKDLSNSTPIAPFNNLLNKDEKENKYSLDISSL